MIIHIRGTNGGGKTYFMKTITKGLPLVVIDDYKVQINEDYKLIIFGHYDVDRLTGMGIENVYGILNQKRSIMDFITKVRKTNKVYSNYNIIYEGSPLSNAYDLTVYNSKKIKEEQLNIYLFPTDPEVHANKMNNRFKLQNHLHGKWTKDFSTLKNQRQIRLMEKIQKETNTLSYIKYHNYDFHPFKILDNIYETYINKNK